MREIEVTSFVPPKLVPQFADAEEVARARAADSRPHCHGAGAQPERRRARRRARRAQAQFRDVGEPQHNLKNVRREREESLEDFKRIADRAAPRPEGGRNCCRGPVDRVRLLLRGPRRRTTTCALRGAVAEAAPTRSCSPTRSATPTRRGAQGVQGGDGEPWAESRWARISTTRAAPAWPMSRRRSTVGVRRFDASLAGSAAARSRRAPAATS